ncbi:hypothetical protein ACFE04_030162 [Oxalis oulophora]
MSSNKIPVKFERFSIAFSKASKAATARPFSDGNNSGSEHLSPDEEEDLIDLSDLVNSFIEKQCFCGGNDQDVVENDDEISLDKDEDDEEEEKRGQICYCSYIGRKEMLEGLLESCNDVDIVQKIRAQVELIAMSSSLSSSSLEFKRHLMARLRECGFDAGVCKSQWEKLGRHPSGSYDYVDLNHNGIRYIVSVFLSREFEIARPTMNHISMLDMFPLVLVATLEDMKQLAKIMCASIRESMKSMELHLPPWRRNGYTQAKWFGPYKRTTKEFSSKSSPYSPEKLSIGFEVLPVKSYRL